MKPERVTVYEVWSKGLMERYCYAKNGEKVLLERIENPQIPFVKVRLVDAVLAMRRSCGDSWKRLNA